MLATVTTFIHNPFVGKDSDRTAPYERLQTTGSKTTMGAFNIFASATASDDFVLDSVLVNLSLASGNSDVILYAEKTVLCQFPTLTAGPVVVYNLNFAPGIVCGTTTTGTVSMAIATATCTARFFATGWRKL
jgi:hypothetical protein